MPRLNTSLGIVISPGHVANVFRADRTVLAWAIAANSGEAHEVESMLTESFALCGVKTKPILAQLHYHAAKAYAALRCRKRVRIIVVKPQKSTRKEFLEGSPVGCLPSYQPGYRPRSTILRDRSQDLG